MPPPGFELTTLKIHFRFYKRNPFNFYIENTRRYDRNLMPALGFELSTSRYPIQILEKKFLMHALGFELTTLRRAFNTKEIHLIFL